MPISMELGVKAVEEDVKLRMQVITMLKLISNKTIINKQMGSIPW